MGSGKDAGLGGRLRKLAVRYDRHAASVLAFLHLACALICARKLQPL